jgi:hypothetical protein
VIAALLDLSVAVNMLENSRSDGTMILMGAAAMFFTTLLPRLSSYAFSYALHTAAGLVALSLGPDTGSKAGRLTNFAGVMVISLAVAYKSEVGRRYWPAAALARAQRVVPTDRCPRLTCARVTAAEAAREPAARLAAAAVARGRKPRGCVRAAPPELRPSRASSAAAFQSRARLCVGMAASEAVAKANDADAARRGFERAVGYICHEARAREHCGSLSCLDSAHLRTHIFPLNWMHARF